MTEASRTKAKVFFFTVAALCTYGVLHDQVTVRVCLEYFTVAHPPLFPVESPTLLAICWGIAATIGVGAIAGALFARLAVPSDGRPYPLSRLLRSIVSLLGAMAVCALVAGLVGYRIARFIPLPADLALAIPEDRHERFIAVWFAHAGSYLSGAVGGWRLGLRIWREQGRPRLLAMAPTSPAGFLRAAVILCLGAVLLWYRFAAR